MPKSGSSGVDQFKKPIHFQKERPYCTRCQINGHTIDTCYRIHGYPSGYKYKSKPKFENHHTSGSASYPRTNPPTVVVNNVAGSIVLESKSDVNFFQTLTPDQHTQLMKMFIIHLSTPSLDSHTPDRASSSFTTCICLSASLMPSLSTGKPWILDSGASGHICSDARLFEKLTPLQNSLVTLPNRNIIPVQAFGDIRLSSFIFLKNTLCS